MDENVLSVCAQCGFEQSIGEKKGFCFRRWALTQEDPRVRERGLESCMVGLRIRVRETNRLLSYLERSAATLLAFGDAKTPNCPACRKESKKHSNYCIAISVWDEVRMKTRQHLGLKT